MKKLYTSVLPLSCFVFISLILFPNTLQAQCNNADFETGDFTGWTGTNFDGVCTSSFLGICTCSATDPYYTTGFAQGPNNDPPSDNSNEYCQVITTSAGGNDPNLFTYSATLPTVWPGSGGYSARIGNMWQAVGTGNGDGESVSYSFLVTPANCNFTYHYAVVLNDGGHSAGEQPYFNIKMSDGSGNDIPCADYEVDATAAQTIGGFNNIVLPAIWWKPWTSVFIPLNNYMGQTVKITFTTRGCLPSGCNGSHYAYAYIDAECAPLTLVASSPTVCGGSNITLTAPAGAATYSWSGPGIVSGGNSQVVTIDQAGTYVVAMTTFGNTPCNFSLDTIVPPSPHNPVANFSAPIVCVGSPTTFTDASIPAGSITAWAWDFNNNGTTNSTTQNPTYTFPAAGTYPVKLTITWPPCTADTIINVVVSPAPTSDFTATSPVCEGTNSNIVYTGTAPNTATYTWGFAGGTIASGTGQGPYQVNWATGGTKNLTLTVAIGSCLSPPTTVPVVVNPFPGLVLPPDTSICTGGSVGLTASGANSYVWVPVTGLSSGVLASVIASPAITTTYTVTGTSASCTGVSTVTVTVNPVPTSPFTVQTPVCAGANSTITYTGNMGPGAAYTWNFDGGTATPLSGQGPFQVNWSTAGTKNITLTVSQSGCSSPQTTMPVVVNPIPTSTFTVISPVCTGQNSTITYTGNASGAAAYTWGFSGGTVVSGAGVGPYGVNWATAGTQNVTLSVTDNGCNSPLTTVPVVINAIPTSTFMGVSPVCAWANTTLTYTGTAGVNATYAWGFAGGTAAPGGTVRGPQLVNWPTAGIETVTLTVTENGCVGPPDTVLITVNATPTSAFTVVSPVCIGQTSTITYTGTGDNLAAYVWSFAGGNAVPGTGQGPQQITWATAGTKNIGLVVSENGCTSPPTVIPVIVHPIPTATFTVTTPLCLGQNSTITYTGTGSSAATFTWGFSGGNVVSGSSQGPYLINWGTPGIYEVSLAVTDSGCVANPDSTPVTINAIPVSDAGADTAYCSGNSVPIGNANTTGYTYLWSPATGLSSATVSNPTVSLTNSANNILTQTYTVTTTSNGCTSSDAAVVTVNPVPAAHFTHPAPQCFTGNTFNFAAGGTFLPGATIAWNFGTDATPANSILQSQTVTYSAPVTAAITLTIVQTSTLCTSTYIDSVTVYPMPQANFSPDTVLGCENFEVCFTNGSVGVTQLNYLWNFGDGAISGDPNPCHLYVAPGVYSVYLKVTSSQGCVDTTNRIDLIKVIADPIAKFTPSATVIQQPESEIDFTNESTNALTYLWTFDAMGNSTDVNPKVNFVQYGLYSVMLRAYNMLGCVDSTQLPITVLPPQSFFIPNAFTPNGDGNNDVFYIDMQEGVTLRSFEVFDRWGEKVHDGLYPWDGTFKGKPCPPAVYVYVVKMNLVTDVVGIMRRGSVTLIR